ncbi:hypothetical protein [Candidatus Binatus sp.]|uniref:hypothetical protein n=1 Tax=Candidatus Binatus sp. TaxID=2811406 RepID=UPI002FDAD9FC
MSFSVARLAIAELSRILGVEQVALGNSRLATGDFARMKNRLEEFGLQFVEADAELRLAQFRATYEPFLGGLRFFPREHKNRGLAGGAEWIRTRGTDFKTSGRTEAEQSTYSKGGSRWPKRCSK